MDELAYQLADRPGRAAAAQPHRRRPASATRGPATGCAECLRLGAERFGWSERNPAPRTTRDGDWLIGTGMAAAAYPVAFFMPPQRARARILRRRQRGRADRARRSSAPACSPWCTQVGADALGVALRDVRLPSRRHRPAQQHARRWVRPAPAWSARPCTPPAPPCASSSSRWPSATSSRRCTAPTRPRSRSRTDA